MSRTPEAIRIVSPANPEKLARYHKRLRLEADEREKARWTKIECLTCGCVFEYVSLHVYSTGICFVVKCPEVTCHCENVVDTTGTFGADATPRKISLAQVASRRADVRPTAPMVNQPSSLSWPLANTPVTTSAQPMAPSSPTRVSPVTPPVPAVRS